MCRPRIEVFAEELGKTDAEIKHLLLNVDTHYWPDLEKKLMEWRDWKQKLDQTATIVNQKNILIGSKPATEVDAEMIKSHEGELKIQGANAMNPYILLYSLSKMHGQLNPDIEAQLVEETQEP